MENPKTLQLDFGFEIKPIPKEQRKPVNEKKAQEDFVFLFMDCLTSPVIVFPSAWQDAIPKNLLGNVTMSRLLCQLSGEQMASLTEVVAYMMPRTFESPMPYEWVNIYSWSGLQYAKQFKSEEEVKCMEEIVPKTLSEYEMGLLNHLRIWIYDKRRKALKARLKDTKKTKIASTPIQENLFEN